MFVFDERIRPSVHQKMDEKRQRYGQFKRCYHSLHLQDLNLSNYTDINEDQVNLKRSRSGEFHIEDVAVDIEFFFKVCRKPLAFSLINYCRQMIQENFIKHCLR